MNLNLHDDFRAKPRPMPGNDNRPFDTWARRRPIFGSVDTDAHPHRNQNTLLLLIVAILAGALIVNYVVGGG